MIVGTITASTHPGISTNFQRFQVAVHRFIQLDTRPESTGRAQFVPIIYTVLIRQ